MEEKVILTMRGICKYFPGVKALDKVDFTLQKGEIHALMGENGAGKSTLIKVLTGVYEAEQGELRINGIEGTVVNHSVQEAQERGISTVYQEINLCPNLTVAENIFIGREPKKHGFIDWKTMNKKSDELLKSLDINIDVTAILGNFSLAIQQMTAIARAVDMSAKVLILDEPTSSLDDEEVAKLFKIMRRLKDSGVGIIFVTHFLDQVYEVCDRITVLRNGKLEGEYPISELPRLSLVAKMIGKDLDDLASIKSLRTSEPSKDNIIQTSNLGHTGTIKPFDLEIKKGEVIGLAGLLGSGRSELARCLYGADKPDCGTMEFKNKTFKTNHPLDSVRSGMAYLPEDRKKEGIIADLSVRENIILALQSKKGLGKLISKKDQEKFADEYISLLQIKTASRETPIKSLSGGNQQKVIIGRWLLTHPEFIILDEPTRGIDIGTKTEIQKLVLKLANEGTSVLFISSEIDEMLRTCNHIAILRDGEKVAELKDSELSQKTIMNAIAGTDK
ncbi:MAG: sugar ABC transporter ATP-binding protein [Spirochaetales bacterium]|nr:sugar ABC transporter ATP-binding protein [Spirochaetales bacterium]